MKHFLIFLEGKMGFYLSRTIRALIFAHVLFFGASLFAQFLVPTNGPAGGTVLSLTEISNGDLYVSISDLGILNSQDSGLNWQLIFPQSVDVPWVLSRDQLGRLYRYAYGAGIYSRDTTNGYWHALAELPIDAPQTQWFMEDLLFDLQNRIFAFVVYSPAPWTYETIIYVSHDFGGTWDRLAGTPFDSLNFSGTCIAVDHQGCLWVSGTHYESLTRSLYRTDPALSAWTELFPMGNNTRFIPDIFSEDSGFVYLNTDEEILRYDMRDDEWTELHPVVQPDSSFRLLHVTPNAAVFSEQSDGFYRSSDHGDNWTRIGRPACFSHSGISSVSNGDVFIQSYYDGLFKLDEASQEWIQSSEGIQAANVYGFEFTENGSIYVKGPQLTYKSADRGESWTHVFGPMRIVRGFTGQSPLLFAVAGDSLYRSEDEGESWTFVLPVRISILEETMQGTLIAGRDSLWRSTDRGLTWTAIINASPYLGPMAYLQAIARSGYALFAYITNNNDPVLLRSLDDGLTWDLLEEPPAMQSADFIADAYGHLFYWDNFGGDAWYRSDDLGDSWVTLAGLPISNNGCPTELYPASDGRLVVQYYRSWFVSNDHGAILESFDFGETWNRIPGTFIEVHQFAEDADGYLYAGTDRGVYISSEPILSIGSESHPVPTEFTLYQNYPNPFNSTTTFAFDLPSTGPVTMQVFDITGRLAATPMSGNLTAGYHSLIWDADALASGIYFYRLKTGQKQQTKKLTLIK